jgi:hypothetical protein
MVIVSIRSPFQLLAAIEWLLRLGPINKYLIIRANAHDGESVRQIGEILNSFKFLFFGIGYWWEEPDEFVEDLLERCQQSRVFALIWSQPDDSKNKELFFLSAPRLVVHVDDGTATLRRFTESKNFALPAYSIKSKLRLRLSSLFNLRCLRLQFTLAKPETLIFTIFKPPFKFPYPVTNHNFSCVKHSLSAKEKPIGQVKKPPAWIIGSPYSEKNLFGIDFEQEVGWICAASDRLREKGFSTRYIAHRYDCENKIEAINRSGILSGRAAGSVEFEALTGSMFPAAFASIGSTALVSLDNILPSATTYRIIPRKASETLMNHLDDQYRSLDAVPLFV